MKVKVKRVGAVNETSFSVTTERDRIWMDMSSELQQVARALAAKYKEETKNVLEARWEMGRLLVEVKENEETKYGPQPIEKLAAFLGRPPAELYINRDLARSYTKNELGKLVERRMSDGGFISMSHLSLLMRLSDKNDREQMTARVFKEGLSVKDLESEIVGMTKRNLPRKKSGRKPKKPINPMAAVVQVDKQCRGLVKRIPVWTPLLDDGLQSMPPDAMTDALREKLFDALGTVTEMISLMGDVQKLVESGLTRVDRVLTLRSRPENKGN